MISEIDDDGSLPDADQAGVYRVVQEALRNVVKLDEAQRLPDRAAQPKMERGQ